MKIRTGWVSNSSSSSFILCGVALPCSCIDDNAEELKEFFTDQVYQELVDNKWDLYSVAEDHGLQLEYDDNEGEYIGIFPPFDQDEMTFGKCRELATESINKVLRKPGQLSADFIVGCNYS